jgi:hypothetical protein
MDKKIKLVGKLILAYFLLIGICFLIYILVVIPEPGVDKVNSIIGLLGWSATIFTPIAAFILLDSWKNQIKYNARLEQIINIIDELSKLSKQIDKVRNDPIVFSYLYKLFLAYEDYQNNDIEIFEIPEFTDIFQTLENIRVCNLKIYIYDEQIQSHIFQKRISGEDSYEKLERYIKGLQASFVQVKMHRKEIDKGINSEESIRHLQKCLYISSNFANAYRSSINPSVDNIFLEQLNSAIEQSFEDIKIFRKSLN